MSRVVAGWSWNPSTSSTKAPRVSGQSTGTIREKTNGGVLLFGGLTGAAGSPTTNDLWRFDPTHQEWTALQSSVKDAATPRVRMYAASATLGSKFYIFGGWDPMEPGSGGEFLNDVWSFDWTTETWSEETARLPFPVSRHAAATVNDDMIIIHTYKGILIFKDGEISEQATEGDAPDSLSMCAMTAIGHKVVIFGGSDKNQRMSSELYVLDTNNWTWSKLENQCKEDGPTAMASPCIAVLNKDKCIVFGGAGLAPSGYEGGFGLMPKDDTWLCTISEKVVEWEQIELDTKPEGRVAASLNVLGEGKFLLQGGYDPVSKATFEQPWILTSN
eukprot:CAMPEP_0183729418 /NCGR_PEP_ID=MMETSP0737-20130205/30220_1 /TAXON_ID=385413 /ORGANISM="Thalassiosira miniscula, Strain CCMP1093" /LENGTH=329 /DNA_ID=CAMNT_0025961595 /DNA_START=147 /DNA_END=1136 /DNA_ORIENTATION=+